MNETKNYYTLKEVRSIVYSNNLSLTTLAKLAREGKIPVLRYSSKILVPGKWVEAMVKESQELADKYLQCRKVGVDVICSR